MKTQSIEEDWIHSEEVYIGEIKHLRSWLRSISTSTTYQLIKSKLLATSTIGINRARLDGLIQSLDFLVSLHESLLSEFKAATMNFNILFMYIGHFKVYKTIAVQYAEIKTEIEGAMGVKNQKAKFADLHELVCHVIRRIQVYPRDLKDNLRAEAAAVLQKLIVEIDEVMMKGIGVNNSRVEIVHHHSVKARVGDRELTFNCAANLVVDSMHSKSVSLLLFDGQLLIVSAEANSDVRIDYDVRIKSDSRLFNLSNYKSGHVLLLFTECTIMISIEDHLSVAAFSAHFNHFSSVVNSSRRSLIPRYEIHQDLSSKSLLNWSRFDVIVWLLCENLEPFCEIFWRFKISGSELANLSDENITVDMGLGSIASMQILTRLHRLLDEMASKNLSVLEKGSFAERADTEALKSEHTRVAEFITVPFKLVTFSENQYFFVIRMILRNSKNEKQEIFVKKSFSDIQNFEMGIRKAQLSDIRVKLPLEDEFMLSFSKSKTIENYFQNLCATPGSLEIVSDFLGVSPLLMKETFLIQAYRKRSENTVFEEFKFQPSEVSRPRFLSSHKQYCKVDLTENCASYANIMRKLSYLSLRSEFREQSDFIIKALSNSKIDELEKLTEKIAITKLRKDIQNFSDKASVFLKILKELPIHEKLKSAPLSKWFDFWIEFYIRDEVRPELLKEFLHVYGYKTKTSNSEYLNKILLKYKDGKISEWCFSSCLLIMTFGSSNVNSSLISTLGKSGGISPFRESLIFAVLEKNLKARFHYLLDIFMPSSKLVTNTYGMSSNYRTISVSSIGWSKFKLAWKKYPEFPGIQNSTLKLSELLFESMSANTSSELFRIDSEPTLLLAETKCSTLLEYYTKNADKYNSARTWSISDTLDSFSVSQLIIFCLLVNPEDFNPENFFIEPLNSEDEKFQIILRSSFRCHANAKDVKCCLYFLDQMKHPVDEKVKDMILSWNANDLMIHWIQSLIEYNQQIREDGFTYSEREQARREGCFLPGIAKIEILVSVYEKILFMQHLFGKFHDITHIELLKIIEPGVHFSENLIWLDEISSFYKCVGKSTLSFSQFLNKTFDIDNSTDVVEKILHGDLHNPEIANEFFLKYFFLMLKTEELLFDWSRLDELGKESSERIRILQLNMNEKNGSDAFWKDLLIPALASRLYSMILKSCSGLSSVNLDRISPYCKGLETLDLSFTSGISNIGGPSDEYMIDFPSLKELKLNNMPDLQFCAVSGKLECVEAQHCHFLGSLIIQSYGNLEIINTKGSKCRLVCKSSGSDTNESFNDLNGYGSYLQNILKSTLMAIDWFSEKSDKEITLDSETKVKFLKPSLFYRIHAQCNESIESIISSICESGPLKGEISKAKSESLFFSSSDKKFILKSMKHDEWNIMASDFLSSYVNHIHSNENSFLSRFFLCFKIRNSKSTRHFIVMNNVFCSNRSIHEIFDLKGSTAAREVTLEEFRKNKGNVIWKDVDWEKKRYKLEICKETGKQLKIQIQQDTLFLKNHRLMDYSFLVGISYDEGYYREIDHSYFIRPDVKNLYYDSDENLEESKQYSDSIPNQEVGNGNIFKRHDGGIRAQTIDGKSLHKNYYLGIIDIFQTFDIRKAAERAVKTKVKAMNDISSVEPDEYYERFIRRITRMLE
jgi:1-phosphatidylinositol-4-phosphate 5-kinase